MEFPGWRGGDQAIVRIMQTQGGGVTRLQLGIGRDVPEVVSACLRSRGDSGGAEHQCQRLCDSSAPPPNTLLDR